MNRSSKVHRITLTAILMAVILLMSFTPLGYLRVGIVSITFLAIPVVIGAILLGPLYGGLLGAVFGLTSFAPVLWNGRVRHDADGDQSHRHFCRLSNPPVLIGVIAGLLYRLLRRWDRGRSMVRCGNGGGGLLPTPCFMVVFCGSRARFGGWGVLGHIRAYSP